MKAIKNDLQQCAAPALKLAIESQQQGHFQQAASHYLAYLRVDPSHSVANHNMGVLALQGDTPASSLAYFMKALESEPAQSYYWVSYIEALLQLGYPDAARDVLSLARQQGQHGAEIDNIAARIDRGGASLSCVQGGMLSRLQGMEPDLQSRDQLVALFSAGRYAEAELLAKSMTEHYPLHGFGWKVLGAVYKQTGQDAAALLAMQKSAELSPDDAAAHSNLGLMYYEMLRLVDAESSLRCALKIDPDFAEAHNNLGLTLEDMGLLADAEACFHRALQIKPDYAEAHSNLGNTLLSRGRTEEAAASYRRALQIKPDYTGAHSNLIFTLDLMVDVDTASLQNERRAWNAKHAAHLYQLRPFANTPEPDRRLRIGYVSADFRRHSAAYAFGAMLTNFDPARFDVFAYSNSMVEDDLTREFKQSVTAWRKIYGLPDDTIADLIREDRIDILVDLSGHSAGNRLLVFARKPAPIQISAWGYAAGTGMTAMDVLFSDPVFVPPEEKPLYAEQVRYLPCAIGFYRHVAVPAVNVLPAMSGRGITFGSFNRLIKNSEATYSAWAKVLRALPDSRMIVKTPAMDDAVTRELVQGYFTREGIAPARIVLQGKTSREAHLAAFSQVDIALDPFPHGGGVTALEGLTMGVPLITLRWPTLTGRVSASIMTTLGLPDWIADTPQQYVDLAVQKASDLSSLAKLRERLRDIFTSSIIGDQAAYMRTVEREYAQLWQEWCARNQVQRDA